MYQNCVRQLFPLYAICGRGRGGKSGRMAEEQSLPSARPSEGQQNSVWATPTDWHTFGQFLKENRIFTFFDTFFVKFYF